MSTSQIANVRSLPPDTIVEPSELKAIAVEPVGSPVMTQVRSGEDAQPGPHKIQGIGAGFIPGVMDLDLVDEVLTVDENVAMEINAITGLVEERDRVLEPGIEMTRIEVQRLPVGLLQDGARFVKPLFGHQNVEVAHPSGPVIPIVERYQGGTLQHERRNVVLPQLLQSAGEKPEEPLVLGPSGHVVRSESLQHQSLGPSSGQITIHKWENVARTRIHCSKVGPRQPVLPS